MFWSELTYANGMNLNLIQGSFSSADFLGNSLCAGAYGGTPYSNCFPGAAIGQGNLVYVNSWLGTNYYGIQQIMGIGAGYNFYGVWGFTVAQAYAIDRKLDDSLPTSGNVIAAAIGVPGSGQTMGFTSSLAQFPVGTAITASLPASANSCFDNGGNAGTSISYSTAQNNGAGLNCAMSFKMQGGD